MIAKVSGNSFEDFMDLEILQPLADQLGPFTVGRTMAIGEHERSRALAAQCMRARMAQSSQRLVYQNYMPDTTNWFSGVAVVGLLSNPFNPANCTGIIGAVAPVNNSESFVYQIRNVNYTGTTMMTADASGPGCPFGG